jgi:hypothetical protein
MNQVRFAHRPQAENDERWNIGVLGLNFIALKNIMIKNISGGLCSDYLPLLVFA